MANSIGLVDAWRVVRQYWADNSPNRLIGRDGLLMLLMSAQNSAASKSRFNIPKAGGVLTQTNNGKRYVLNIEVRPSRNPADTLGQSSIFCGATSNGTPPKKTMPFTIKNKTISEVFEYDNDYFKNVIDDARENTDLMTNDLQSFMTAFAEQVSEYVANPANGYVGRWIGSAAGAPTVLNLPLFHTQDSRINAAGESVLSEISSRHAVGDLVLVGGALPNSYAEKKGWSGLDATGLDAAKVNVLGRVVRDNRVSNVVNAAFGVSGGCLAVGKGSMALVTYNSHKGINKEVDDFQQRIYTIVEPFYGIEIDVAETRKIECVNGENIIKHRLQYSIMWDVLGAPCFSDDPAFSGVSDVIAVNIKEEDTTIAAAIAAIQLPSQTIAAPLSITPSSVVTAIDCITVTKCNAAFTAVQKMGANILTQQKAFAAADKITQFACGAANISLALPINGNSGFMVGSMLELAAAQTAINAGLVAAGVDAEVMHLSYDGANLNVFMFAGAGIATANVVVGASGMNIDAIRYANPVLVTSLSQPSTGATLTDCSYPTFHITGAPNAILDPIVGLYYGTNSRFCIEPNVIGTSIDHSIMDSANCTDTVTNTVV
jgi:hypothetical protein